MKHIISLLSILITGLPCFTQNIVKQQYAAPEKKTVTMRNLKPTIADNQLPYKGKSRSANEQHEKMLLPKKKSKPENFRLPFPVKTVSTAISTLNNKNGNTPAAVAIYESPCVNFQGLPQYTGPLSTSIPPDVGGAVGFDEIFMVLNDRFKVQNKNGDSLYQQREDDPNGFWSPLGATNLFDPKIIYDPYRHRWIFVILKDGASGQPQNSSILLAVSQTPDPLGGWFQWQIDGDAQNDEWFDYPSIGFNRNWLIINGNLFPIGSGGSRDSRTFAFNIDNLYAGVLSSYTVFTTTNYATICPALTYDPNVNDLWCVTNDDTDDNDLRFFKISGTASNPSMTEEGYISIGTNWGRGIADIGPQLGRSVRINLGDHRIKSVIWRDGRLYAVQTIFLPDDQDPADLATIQFVSCTPSSTTVHEAIRFAASSISMYAYPCLAFNNRGDIIISCSKFTAGTYPSAVVLVRRNAGGFVETTFKQGEDWYISNDNSSPPRNRWGDYTTAMIDPSDDNTVWVASEYAMFRPTGSNGQWGTWWAKICSGICASTVSFNEILMNGEMRKFEAADIVYGNGVVNPGTNLKLDAGNKIILGNGFRALEGSKVRAYIDGCGGVQ